MKKTRVNPIGRKHRERIESWGSEVDIFRKVLIRADWYCELTKRYVYEPKSYNFAHILPKGTWPEFRLDPNNIILVYDIDTHQKVDELKSGMREELAEMVRRGTAVDFIKNKYYAHYIERQDPI